MVFLENSKNIEEILGRLVVRKSGVKKNPIALVIPSGKSSGLLEEHLKLLVRQTRADFDVIVIGDSPKAAPEKLNLIFYEEVFPLGSSGGFGIGQVIGYTLGYEFVINADADCYPDSDNLIERIVERSQKEQKAVFPVSYEDGVRELYFINRYGVAPRSVFEKAGFEYVLFFKGGEDFEYMHRLELAGLMVLDKSAKTVHPLTNNTLVDMAGRGVKYLYYHRALFAAYLLVIRYSLEKLKLKSAALYTARLFFWFTYYFIFSLGACRPLIRAAFDGLLLNFGKRYRDSEMFSIPQAAARQGMVGIAADIGDGQDRQDWQSGVKGKNQRTLYFMERNRDEGIMTKIGENLFLVKRFAQLFFIKGDYFGPTEKFLDKYYFFMPYMMFAKPVLYKEKLYAWNRSVFWVFAGAALAAAAAAAIPLLAAASLLRLMADGSYPPMPKNLSRMLEAFYKGVINMKK